jgi:flagellar basal body-associated protein FliL
MLIPMALASILALGGLWITLVALSGVALLVMAGYAFWKMRSDDFWEEQD